MRLSLLSFILFIFFLIEGTILQVFVPDAWGYSFTIVPRFVLVGIVFIGLYQGRNTGLIFGLIFGVLYDIVYTNMIGVYTLSMGMVGFLAGMVSGYFHRTMILTGAMIIILTSLNEGLTFGFYQLFGLSNMGLQQFILNEWIPTVIFNAIFALIIHIPMRKILKDRDFDEQIV